MVVETGVLGILGVILLLANRAEQQRTLGISGRTAANAALVMAGATYFAMLVAGLLLGAAGLLMRGFLASSPAPQDLSVGLLLPRLALAIGAPSVLGLFLLMPFARASAARLIPLDPASTVHAVALSYSALVLANLAITLAIGLGELATALQIGAVQGDAILSVGALWVQNVLLFMMSLVGVGWLVRRTLAQVLQRLGIVRPSLAQVGLGVALGAALVPISMGAQSLASAIGIPGSPEVDRLTELLFGPLAQTLPGILTIGLAAALGEETLFRGALQPRFGLIFTAILFALVHMQYGLSQATAIVLLLALALGWARKRHNTSTAMVLHATYNILIGLIEYLHVTGA